MKILFIINEIPFTLGDRIKVASHNSMLLTHESWHKLDLVTHTNKLEDLFQNGFLLLCITMKNI